MATFKGMFKKFLGFEDEETAESMEITSNTAPVKEKTPAEAPVSLPNKEITLYPKNFGDACEVVEQLEEGITVIVNMDDVDIEDCKRITDFVLGAIFVLRGDVEKISKKVFRFWIDN